MEGTISFDVTATSTPVPLLPPPSSLQASNNHTSSKMFTHGFYLVLNRTIYERPVLVFSRISSVITNIPVSQTSLSLKSKGCT